MLNIGKGMMLLGGIIVILGAVIYFISRAGFPFGSLPGDIQFRQGNFACVIPIATSLILSVLLTILLNIVIRFFNH